MARSCIELLEPNRYGMGAPNFLLAQAQLAFPGENAGESLAACGLLDLTGTRFAAASVALQEAALLEGKTSRHLIAPPEMLDGAHQLAVAVDAVSFDCVVAIGSSWPILLERRRLPGAWLAVSEHPENIPVGVFDLLVSARGSASVAAARVFRMLSSLLAKNTGNCMDLEDFIEPLKVAPACRLLDAYLLPGNDEVQIASLDDEKLLQAARGVVVVHHLIPGLDTLTGAKRTFNSIRERASKGVTATVHWPIGARGDVAGRPVREIDVLVA